MADKKSRSSKAAETTHESFWFMLVLAQCFAMVPVLGISGPDFRSLSFRWKSWRLFYSILYLALLLANILILVVRAFSIEAKLGSFVTVLFFLCSFVTTIIFINVARGWPQLMEKWTDVDASMAKAYAFPKELHFKLKLLATSVMSAAALEHSLFLSFAISKTPKSYKGMEAINLYFRNNYAHVFEIFPYSFWIGLIMQIINILSTFTWNYMDLFIMLISTALADRFKQVATRLKSAAEAPHLHSVSFWKEVREDYNNLNVLSKAIDGFMGNIIMLSFANNLFVILIQLLNSLEYSPSNKGSLLERFYFVYSFGFLILRTIAVSLICARIDVESKEPMQFLTTLPGFVYNVEIERLLQQIKNDPCALTGRRFFTVSKSLIFSVAGAIVTYELIFIQFNIR